MTDVEQCRHESGFVAVSDGAVIYFEDSGAPEGIATLWLHGGPGGSLGAGHYRRIFPLDMYRLIAIDQRGNGRSRPNVLDDLDSLPSYTTQQLIADIEAVRISRGVEKWVVTGASWGTTLALAYAQEHPERVAALGLLAVGTTSRSEVDWITEGVGRFFPAEWSVFESASRRRDGERVVDAYARRLAAADSIDSERAARDWDRWENVHVSLDNPASREYAQPGSTPVDAVQRRAFATLVTHYWSHDAFLADELAILERMNRISHIPTALVHGRRDISSPVSTAWRLHQTLPASALTIVEHEGHGGPDSEAALTESLRRFAATGSMVETTIQGVQ